MKFRPCIDIHNGKVKQIVGGSLRDTGNFARENFVSGQDGAFYAALYREHGLNGGHIILLNPADSPYYQEDLHQAELALREYPQGLMIGGGVHAENAEYFLAMGASHVIVTSYVFRDGKIDYNRLENLKKSVGRKHIVLDLSCRRTKTQNGEAAYYIVTDRWQKFTQTRLNKETLEILSGYCDEFLVHAVDMEGKSGGIEQDVASILGKYSPLPATYAGGVASFDDLKLLQALGQNRVDVTIGSALDLFGGKMGFLDVVAFCLKK